MENTEPLRFLVKNEEITVEQSIAFQSGTLQEMRDIAINDVIPLPDFVTTDAFYAYIDACSDLSILHTIDWDVFLIVAELSNYLCHTDVKFQCIQRFKNAIKKHTVEELRAMWNIESDFTPEEEEAVRKEFEWCQNPF